MGEVLPSGSSSAERYRYMVLESTRLFQLNPLLGPLRKRTEALIFRNEKWSPHSCILHDIHHRGYGADRGAHFGGAKCKF